MGQYDLLSTWADSGICFQAPEIVTGGATDKTHQRVVLFGKGAHNSRE